MRKILTTFAAAIVICALSLTAQAAAISFGTPVAIGTANNALNIPGKVVGAAVFGPNAETVTTTGPGAQTINFTNDGSVATIVQGGNTNQSDVSFTGNANFDAVLGQFADDGNPVIVQLQNLSVGQTYEVQLFGVDDRDCCGGRTIDFSDGLGNSSATFAENSNTYAIGTFTANAATENIEAVGVGQFQSNLNALVLREVPEPASLVALIGLCGMGIIGLVARRRRSV